MSKARIYQWTIGLFIGLFLLVQASTLAHATEYGDGPHEHDDVMCVIATLSCEDHVVVPAPPIQPVLRIVVETPGEFDFVSASYVTPQGRAPPPRSPPLNIQ